jgi:hypothetical protein
MGDGGDPDFFLEPEDEQLRRADAELRAAADRVERLLRKDCERFLAPTDEEPRRQGKTTSLLHRVATFVSEFGYPPRVMRGAGVTEAR